MTTRLVAVPELEGEMHAVVERLRRAGSPAELVPGEGLGAEEVRESILASTADLGLVVSRPPEGRGVEPVAVLRRREPRDVIVARDAARGTLARLPEGARIGLSGARRNGLLKAHRPDLRPVALGNGHLPASALESGAVDALIVGAAESRRLGLEERTSEFLDPRSWSPSPGQDAVVVIAGTGDEAARAAASGLNDPSSQREWTCEVALADGLGADPDGPLGALAMSFGHWIRLWGMAASEDGSRVVRGDLTGSMDHPTDLATALADLLLKRGAAQILAGSDR